MSKIQNLNGTHNLVNTEVIHYVVVYDVKDTKFEWNSQHFIKNTKNNMVVYDVKDTKFEWNSQLVDGLDCRATVVYDVKDTKFEWNSQRFVVLYNR